MKQSLPKKRGRPSKKVGDASSDVLKDPEDSLAEKITPTRRSGRQKKATLRATPSYQDSEEEENLPSRRKIMSVKTFQEVTVLNSAEKETPKRRGRPKKVDLPPTPSSPSCPSNIQEESSMKSGRKPKLLIERPVPDDKDSGLETPVSNSRTRKRKAPEDEMISNTPVKMKTTSNVTCGVCKKEMSQPSFTYHRYSVHSGLARLEGEPQEFTDEEIAQEKRKTLFKIKRIPCSKCSANFTTLLGLDYHEKRCGAGVTDLQNMLQECTLCGKRVMALSAHMKVHNKRPEKSEEFNKVERTSTPIPASKSKRAAAQKAASLLKELREDLVDGPTQKPLNKAVKLFTEPSSSKVTNSIIVAWKKQIESKSIAKCRYPSCPFASDNIDKLKEHHVQCEIGSQSKCFACLKCDFRSQDKSQIMEHALNTHVLEKDDEAFELSGSSSDDTDDDEANEDGMYDSDDDNDRTVDRRKSVPQNTKNIEKAYGLSSQDLLQFKSLSTSQHIPIWLAKFHKRNFTRNASLYEDWAPKFKTCIDLPKNYLPSNEESIPFSRRKVTTGNLFMDKVDVTLEKLRRFQSQLQNGTPTFFCGGSIHGVSWCPMPAVVDGSTTERDQYLAVSVLHEEHLYRSASEAAFGSEYLIQIWNCGNIRNVCPAQVAPELEFCIAHNYGRVWSLVWCPSGCYDQERLGLLAAACSDGTVRIFSIPNPTTLTKENSKPLFLLTDANVTLRLNTKEISECTSLDWDSTLGHKFIVAGFANGIVGLWDIHTKSPLLLSGDSLLPVWSFYAHSSVVTAVSLSPHHSDARFLATASTDRTVKLWDRHDLAVPISWSKRSRVTDIRWRRHWPGVLLCVEDVCALFRCSTVFYDFGYTGNKQGLLPQNSVVWSSAENEYLDVIAHSTNAGEVVVYASHLAVFDCDEKKLRKQRLLILRTDLIDCTATKNVFLNRMQKIYLESNSKKAAEIKTQKRESPNYSLVFNDVASSVVRSFGNQKKSPVISVSGENMDVIMPCDDPITSINKISFNPNLESHAWMCVCGENGLVQLLKIDSPSLSKVTTCYVKEMNNSSVDS